MQSPIPHFRKKNATLKMPRPFRSREDILKSNSNMKPMLRKLAGMPTLNAFNLRPRSRMGPSSCTTLSFKDSGRLLCVSPPSRASTQTPLNVQQSKLFSSARVNVTSSSSPDGASCTPAFSGKVHGTWRRRSWWAVVILVCPADENIRRLGFRIKGIRQT